MVSLKTAVKKLVGGLGYEIRKMHSAPLRESVSESYAFLASLGFRPATVIDVGVADGTLELYRAFPDSRLLLIEPLEEFEPELKSILSSHRGLYVLAAAGVESRDIVINVHPDHLHGSSTYKETMGAQADGYERIIRMVTVDDMVAKEGLAGPFLLKVDVQGAELDVLKGAQATLAETEVVALEVSMFELMTGAPQFHDVVACMKKYGFVAFEVVPALNRPLDNALAQVDMIFVKEHGQFRRNHAYALSS